MESEVDEEVVDTSIVVVVVVVVGGSGGRVLEVMPNSAIVVSGSTRPSVVILRRATRAGPEQEVTNIAV